MNGNPTKPTPSLELWVNNKALNEILNWIIYQIMYSNMLFLSDSEHLGG